MNVCTGLCPRSRFNMSVTWKEREERMEQKRQTEREKVEEKGEIRD